MSMFLGFVGLAGIMVFVTMGFVWIKKDKVTSKKSFMYAGISFIIFVVGLSIPSSPEPVAPVATETAAEAPKAEPEAEGPTEEEKAAEAKAKEEAAAQKEAEEKAKAEAEKKEAAAQEKAAAEQAKKDEAEAAKALDAEGISKAEFEEIQNGMTYEEVIAIIGVEGELTSEVGEKGTAYHTVMYTFKGETGLGANAIIMFQGNKLNTKSQFGLE